MPSPWEAGHKADEDAFAELNSISEEIIALLQAKTKGMDPVDAAFFLVSVLGGVIISLKKPVQLLLLSELMKFFEKKRERKDGPDRH